MSNAEFDKFADNYKQLHRDVLCASGESDDFFAEYKIKDVVRIVRKKGWGRNLSILDFGTGIGSSVPFLLKYFPGAQLTCLDVSRKSLDIATSKYHNAATFLHFDGQHIPRPDNSFRLIFSACVFHHIPPEMHLVLLLEIRRVLEPGGIFVTFEHNPYNPLTVGAVRACPLDDNAVLIKGRDFRALLRQTGYVADCPRYRIFFPRFLRVLRPLEQFMTWLPFGAQYFVCAQKPY